MQVYFSEEHILKYENLKQNTSGWCRCLDVEKASNRSFDIYYMFSPFDSRKNKIFSKVGNYEYLNHVKRLMSLLFILCLYDALSNTGQKSHYPPRNFSFYPAPVHPAVIGYLVERKRLNCVSFNFHLFYSMPTLLHMTNSRNQPFKDLFVCLEAKGSN